MAAPAAVSTDSARIDDALSTFNAGVISAINAIAQRKGVPEGMKASEAAGLMLG